MGECKGACGRVAGTRTVITSKLVASPARYGGEECDLEPEKKEEPCITDCCKGDITRTNQQSYSFFPVKCDEIPVTTNTSCSTTCSPGYMEVTTVKRTRRRNSRGCNVCSEPETTKEVVKCNDLIDQACPPGNCSNICPLNIIYSEHCEGETIGTNPGKCSVDCRRNATLYYTKITKEARYNGKDCVNGTRGQEDCIEAPCIKVSMIGHIWF